MTQEQEKKTVNELSRVAALTFVTARAFNLWNSELEKLAKRLGSVHTYDTKYALKQIADGCAKAAKGAEHFEEWAVNAGITESGHSGDAIAIDSFLNDGAWVAVLTALSFNAAACNPECRTIIESYCKSQVKGEPLISYEFIEKLKPVI